jgi:phosphohistidine phosphatase SixA
MRLYLVRHGEPVRGGPFADADRPLTADGMRQVEILAQALVQLVEAVPRIAASPARRCRDSAAILAAAFALPEAAIESRAALAMGSAPGPALAALDAEDGDWAWVGHEPWLTVAAAHLLEAPQGGGLRFECAGCAAFDVDATASGPRGTLRWLLGPGMLDALR